MPYFHLCGDDYIRNIFTGFAHLQEEQELVDLTLAVDGHLVKVHKTIVALASPYIRDIIKKTFSDNLVIYLNNVDIKDLNFLLEYIYQGEVNIPEDSLESFIQLAQSLHITGIDKSTTMRAEQHKQESQIKQSEIHTCQEPMKSAGQLKDSSTPVAVSITVNADHNYQIQQFSEEIRDNLAHGHSTESTVNVGDTLCEISNEISINDAILEQDAIQIKESNVIPTNSIKEVNAFPGNSMEERYDSPENCIISTNYIQTDNMEIIENVVRNTYENLTDTPTNSIKIPSHVVEIANDNNIPLNSIALANDCEIPTDFHVIIPKPSGSDDKSEPYSVKVTPLSSLQESSKELPPASGSNLQFDKESLDALKIISQYSVTERGCIQIIVSRYIYNNHHEARGGRKSRWRCSDYRKRKCPAFIDSLDNRIVLRKGVHNHAYHDDKIYKKHEKGQIYHSLKQAEDVRRKPSIQTVDPNCEDIEQFIDMKYAKK